MTEAIHKETARGWALVAQQLAQAIHAQRGPIVQPVSSGPWYPGAKTRAEFAGGARVLEPTR